MAAPVRHHRHTSPGSQFGCLQGGIRIKPLRAANLQMQTGKASVIHQTVGDGGGIAGLSAAGCKLPVAAQVLLSAVHGHRSLLIASICSLLIDDGRFTQPRKSFPAPLPEWSNEFAAIAEAFNSSEKAMPLFVVFNFKSSIVFYLFFKFEIYFAQNDCQR